MTEIDADVVVVGGGLAGLCAARALESARRSVVVLEASNRVGGKIRTERVGLDHVDLGAHWIGPGQSRIAALGRELGLTTRAQPLDGRTVLLAGGRRLEYRGTIPFLRPPVLADVALGALRLWGMHRGVGFDRSAEERRIELDARTAEQLRDRLYRTQTARALFEMTIGLILGVQSSELSALHLLAFLESGGGLRRMTAFKGGAQQDCFVGGSQQLCNRLAGRLSRPVELSAPVTAVMHNSDSVVVCGEHGERRGRHSILAIPPPLVDRIAFTPTLPPDRQELLRRSHLGAYTKAVASYERPWWREKGLNGIALATEGPVQMVVDGMADSGRGMLVGFITGSSARWFSTLDAEGRRRSALEAFVRLLGQAAADPIDYLDLSWAEEPWILGAPVAHPEPGALADGGLPRAPVGRLHWAGSDLARLNNAYMDGAIESGERAAAEIIART